MFVLKKNSMLITYVYVVHIRSSQLYSALLFSFFRPDGIHEERSDNECGGPIGGRPGVYQFQEQERREWHSLETNIYTDLHTNRLAG